jgi:GntR family transcriptional regulator
MADLRFEPPKYAQIVLEIRRRIESGEYPPGATLPTEAALVREFGVGRTTVVRALQVLQQDGWITREHGRGSFVKGRPETHQQATRPGLAVLDQPETSGLAHLLNVGTAPAPAGVAAVLGVDPGERLTRRQWVNIRDEVPSELVTCWFPPALAYGTDLELGAPLPVGVRDHLRTVKKVRADHIAERLTARMPTEEESSALKLSDREAVLVVLATVHDAKDVARFAVQVIMPGTLHELEDVYSVPD